MDIFVSSWFNNIKREGNFYNNIEHDYVSLLLNKNIHDFTILKSFKQKCNKSSEGARLLANRQYIKNNLVDARYIYSECISLAENNSKELALGYANRSVVLFEDECYELCIADINAALINKYPLYLDYVKVLNLHERLRDCYTKLSLYEKADEVSKLIQTLKSTNYEDIFTLHKQTVSKNSNHCYVTKPPTLVNNNEVYPSASNSIEIVNSDNKGRYATATRDISVGDIIIVEEPFTSLCSPECYKTHCYHCLGKFKINYPCRLCSRVNYCSLSCEQMSWEKFHSFECEYLDAFENVKYENRLAQVAMKTITKVGLTELMCSGNGDSNSKYYSSIYRLTNNNRLRKPNDLLCQALRSIYIGKILCLSNFCSLDNLFIVCDHLFKLLGSISCNEFSILETKLENKSNYTELFERQIGFAVYATSSLLNHSCASNVVCSFYGDTIVMRAANCIKKGEEICFNYGDSFATGSESDRQSHLLSQYYFKCQCEACSNHWPVMIEYDSQPKSTCKTCCKSFNPNSLCKACIEVYSLYASYSYALLDFETSGNVESNLPSCLDYLNCLSCNAKMPSIDLIYCQNMVRKLFLMQGNCI